MWWMQVGMDTLQKLQLLGNDWESSNWNIQKKNGWLSSSQVYDICMKDMDIMNI